ncbi:MAG: NfeD family protein, partial [Terriglobales bacterium]
IWRARSETAVAAGDAVRVLALRGLLLEVEPAARPAEPSPQRASQPPAQPPSQPASRGQHT